MDWTDYEMQGYFFVKNIKSHVGFWTLWKIGAWTYELESFKGQRFRYQAISKKEAEYQALLTISGLGIIVGDLKRHNKPNNPAYRYWD